MSPPHPSRPLAVTPSPRGGRLALRGRKGADSASDTPRSMSGWWSQCPWGKSSAPTERIGSFLTPTGGFGYCRRVFGRSRAPPLRAVVDTARHSTGFGGGRYPLAGHMGPALRRGVVAVYHTPRLGGGRYRAGADRVVRPYGHNRRPFATRAPFIKSDIGYGAPGSSRPTGETVCYAGGGAGRAEASGPTEVANRPLIRHGLFRPCHLLPTLRHPVPRPVGPWQPGRCLAVPSLYPPPAALRAQPPEGKAGRVVVLAKTCCFAL